MRRLRRGSHPSRLSRPPSRRCVLAPGTGTRDAVGFAGSRRRDPRWRPWAGCSWTELGLGPVDPQFPSARGRPGRLGRHRAGCHRFEVDGKVKYTPVQDRGACREPTPSRSCGRRRSESGPRTAWVRHLADLLRGLLVPATQGRPGRMREEYDETVARFGERASRPAGSARLACWRGPAGGCSRRTRPATTCNSRSFVLLRRSTHGVDAARRGVSVSPPLLDTAEQHVVRRRARVAQERRAPLPLLGLPDYPGGLGEQAPGSRGSRSSARAPRGPGPGPSSRCGAAGRGCGGSRPGRRRTPSAGRGLPRRRPSEPTASPRDGRGRVPAYDVAGGHPGVQVVLRGVTGQVGGRGAGHQVGVDIRGSRGMHCPRPGPRWRHDLRRQDLGVLGRQVGDTRLMGQRPLRAQWRRSVL